MLSKKTSTLSQPIDPQMCYMNQSTNHPVVALIVHTMVNIFTHSYGITISQPYFVINRRMLLYVGMNMDGRSLVQ